MDEIFNLSKEFVRVGGRTYGESSPNKNNVAVEQLWDALYEISNGSLDKNFNQLYWFGGAWSPGYDMKREENHPPTANVQCLDTNLTLLLPVYKSLMHRGNLRPAIIGFYTYTNQKDLGKAFMKNLETLTKHLEETEVYAIMKRPNGSLLTSRYEGPQKFRSDYFNIIQGEQGEVLLITNNPNIALEFYQKEQTEIELGKISKGERKTSFVVMKLPDFLKRGPVAKQVKRSITNINSTIA